MVWGIPINSALEKALRRLQMKRTSHEYVFWKSKSGKPVQDVKKSFKSACEDAGIKLPSYFTMYWFSNLSDTFS